MNVTLAFRRIVIYTKNHLKPSKTTSDLHNFQYAARTQTRVKKATPSQIMEWPKSTIPKITTLWTLTRATPTLTLKHTSEAINEQIKNKIVLLTKLLEDLTRMIQGMAHAHQTSLPQTAGSMLVLVQLVRRLIIAYFNKSSCILHWLFWKKFWCIVEKLRSAH